MLTLVLNQFQIIRPKYEMNQEQAIEWMAKAYSQEESINKQLSEEDNSSYIDCLNRFSRWGCKPEHINTRGSELPDFLHQKWEEMEILGSSKAGLGKRLEFYNQQVDAIFEKYYPENALPPNHLIHISCTGYSSPSGAQKLISKRGWGEQTLVTHAYHMGCYGGIAGLRIASGFVHHQGGKADLVHTELCTLYFNPSNNKADQIVLQSLFADGYIKYTLQNEAELSSDKIPSMKIVHLDEQLIPDSSEEMTWNLTDWGFHGTLSKKIPILIATHVKKFLINLSQKAGVNLKILLEKAIFAVHPGGPKILDNIQEILALSSEQLYFSREILRKYGNISSATLPHIWKAILEDSSIIDGTYVVSLAFGPGLNIAGGIFVKTIP